MKNLNTVICSILNINEAEFTTLVIARGMRPVKAAIRLGANVKDSQLFATLQLATKAEDITAIYANPNVTSCMVGKDVGPFYEANNIGVIYSDNYRCLINIKTGALVRNNYRTEFGYGYHRDQISHVLAKYYTSLEVVTNVEYKTCSVKVGEKKRREPMYDVMKTSFNLNGIHKDFEEIKMEWHTKLPEGLIKKIIEETRIQLIADKNALWVNFTYEDSWYCIQISKSMKKVDSYEVERVCPDLYVGCLAKKLKGMLKETKYPIYQGTFYSDYPYNPYLNGKSLVLSMYDVTARYVEVSTPIYKDRIVKRKGLVYPNKVEVPYLDFYHSFNWEPVTVEEGLPRSEVEDEILEDHYWSRLGDSYRESYTRPRTNY